MSNLTVLINNVRRVGTDNNETIASGGLADGKRLVLTGAASAGSTVTVYDGDIVLGTVTLKANQSNWTFITGILKNKTQHDFSAQATKGGDVSNLSNHYIVTVNTADNAVSAPIIEDILVGGSVIPLDGFTNQKLLHLDGKAEPLSFITVYDGSVKFGETQANTAGSWSLNVTVTEDATYAFTATAKSGTVTSVRSGDYTVTVDTKAPDAPTIREVADDVPGIIGTIADNGFTNDPTPVLTGKAEANSTVDIYVDGNKVGSTATNANGNWSFSSPTPLTDGSHIFTATATDKAGNTSVAGSAYQIQVDTTEPTKPGITAVRESDVDGKPTTLVAQGGATTDQTLVLKGIAEAKSSVTIYDGGVQLGTVTANDKGVWAFSSPELTQTAHSFQITATDVAGNTSTSSKNYAVTVNATPNMLAAPVIASVIDSVLPHKGVVASGNSTNDVKPELTGTAVAGSTVNIFNDGVKIGSTTAGDNGKWNFTPTADLSPGSYSFTATATKTGNADSPASTSYVITVSIDKPIAPTIVGLIDNVDGITGPVADQGLTNDANPVLSGKATPGNQVEVKVIYNNDAVPDSRTTVDVDANGNWIFNAYSLKDGLVHFSVTQKNEAGTASTTSIYTVTLDTQAPAKPVILGVTEDVSGNRQLVKTGATTADRQLDLMGKAEANSTVTIYYDTDKVLGTVQADTSGDWEFTTPRLANFTTYNFVAKAEDTAGNTGNGSDIYSVTVDNRTKPDISSVTDNVEPNVGNVLVNGATNDSTLDVVGTAAPNSTVAVYNGNALLVPEVMVDNNGNWHSTVTVSEGANNLIVYSIESKISSDAYTVILDTQAPIAPTIGAVIDDVLDITGTIAKGEFTNDATPILTGLAEANSTVTIFNGVVLLGTALAGSDGKWSFAAPTLINGIHNFRATATDAAGNTSSASSAYSINVDTKAPAKPAINAVNETAGSVIGDVVDRDGVTQDLTLTLVGKAESNSTVTIYDGTTNLGSVIADNTGNWTYATPDLKDKATHAFHIITTDRAGNASKASDDYAVTVDSNPNPLTPPTITSIVDNVGTTITVARNGITNDPRLELNGNADPGSIVTVYRNDSAVVGTTVADSNGAWSLTTAKLSDATYDFTAKVSADGVSSAASLNYTVTVDTEVSSPEITKVTASSDPNSDIVLPGDTVGVLRPVLTGTAEAGSIVTIFNGTTQLGTAKADDMGNWTFTKKLDNGVEYAFNAKVTDVAGNTSDPSDNYTVTINATAPLLTEADVDTVQSGNTVIVTIDPNGQDLTGVTVDFSMFGGSKAVLATLQSDTGLYEAASTINFPTWLIGGTSVTPLDPDVSVTATNEAGSTTVDNIPPVLTDDLIHFTAVNGLISVSVDTLDLLGNSLSSILVDFSAFGGGEVSAVLSGGSYNASISASTDDLAGKYVVVTAVDLVGNVTSFIDGQGPLV
ncbi:MAG: Ig-like domain-containing protein [Methylovulum sp.]|nr:Ig-like domain-containing protein [Methylovulum sp.]